MTDGEDGEHAPPRYLVQEGERAEADRSAIFLRLLPKIGPERANDIFEGLERTIHQLVEFPGPRANATDENVTTLFGIEVRRTFFYGPPARRLSTPYRILYTVIEPSIGNSTGIIRVLRILHGSQELNPRTD